MTNLPIALIIASPLLFVGLLIVGVSVGSARLNHKREGQ